MDFAWEGCRGWGWFWDGIGVGVMVSGDVVVVVRRRRVLMKERGKQGEKYI